MLSDTAPDIQARMYEAYRRMSPSRKWKNLCQDYRMARALHAVGLRRRKPGIGLVAIQADWIESVWGSPCPVPIPEALMEPVEQDINPYCVMRFAHWIGYRLPTQSGDPSRVPCTEWVG